MAFRLHVRDRLLAEDPALSRLRLALRVTLTIVATVSILAGIHVSLWPLPPVAYSLGVTLSMQSGLSVRDVAPLDQFVTRIAGGLIGVVIVALAAGLEDHRYVSDLVFLTVIFLSSYARAFGPRGFALGMFAFMSYFIGAYLHPPLSEIPAAALGAMVAVLVAQAMRVLVLPDDWRRDLARSLVSVDHRIDGILKDIAVAAGEGELGSKRRRRIMQSVGGLKNAVLMAESFLPAASDDDRAKMDASWSGVAVALFDLHLAAESVAVLSFQALPPLQVLDAIRAQDHAAAKRIAGDWKNADDRLQAETVRGLLWLNDMRARLKASVATVVRQQKTHPAKVAAASTPFSWRLSMADPAMRTAIQITLASAIAMGFGLMLSRDRWFWAVLSAFLVFTNTRSRGDTAIKALQRSVGTMLGIAAGLLAATVLNGNIAGLLALALVCSFLAFYMLAVSYAVMTFFVSIIIALVYSMIGVLTPELLVLRLEETLVGTVAGTVVAFMVFPARTQETLDTALQAWSQALRLLLQEAASDASAYTLMRHSQALDRAYQDLTVSAKPLGASWQFVTRPGQVRQTLVIFMACTYWARIAASGLGRASEAPLDIARLAELNITAVDAVSQKGVKVFLTPRPVQFAGKRHLPLSQNASVLGMEMIGISLARLLPENEPREILPIQSVLGDDR